MRNSKIDTFAPERLGPTSIAHGKDVLPLPKTARRPHLVPLPKEFNNPVCPLFTPHSDSAVYSNKIDLPYIVA